MSLAREALRELAALGVVFAKKPRMPVPSLCARQAEETRAPEAVSDLPAPDVLEALRRELQSACAAGGGPGSLPSRVLRRAPLVLWTEETPAAGFPGLLDAFLQAAQTRPRWVRDLIEAWLREFGPDRVLLRETGYAITRLLAEATHPRLVPWWVAHERFAVFEMDEGCRRVGSALFRGPEDVATVMSVIGMHDDLRANGRFFRAAIGEGLKCVPDILRSAAARELWPRTPAVLEVTRIGNDRFGKEIRTPELRFRNLAAETARACLSPWLTDTGPADAPKDAIKSFLLRTIGDPRLNRQRWKDVGEELTGLMRAWLAAASLEAFLSLISQSNNDSQWRYRQAFWRACLRKMPTAEVWVVLGPVLANRAKSIRDLAGGFGRMDGGGQNNDQAVLLMKLGNLVLSEWSNVGPVRAWVSGSRSCPVMYATRYQADGLRATSLDFPGGVANGKGLWHRGGEDGAWQSRAAALLRDRLQLHLTPRDYMR